MKTFSMRLVRSLLAGSLVMLSPLAVASVQAETIVNGVVYPEITDLGKPRLTRAQPQLGSASAINNTPTYNAVPAAHTVQLPPPPQHLVRSTTIAPADLTPTLTPVGHTTTVAQPTVQQAVATPYAYGYGYTSVGSPQKVVQVLQPVGYTNTLPQQQVTYVQPVTYTQPVTNVQPLTTLQSTTAFNPYVQTKGVPWRPIVNIRNMPPNYVVGQGIVGQPKVYVPSQPVRNFIRYITP